MCQPHAREGKKKLVLKNMRFSSLCWHAQFPFLFTVSWDAIKPAHRLFVSFLWWHQFFSEPAFHRGETFECVSYEFSVATSTSATTTSLSYKYERMISSLRSPSHSRKTALPAFFHRGPRSGLPTAPLWKRSKLLCFASWIIKNRVKIKDIPVSQIQHLERKLKGIPVKNGPSLPQAGHM